MRTFRSLALLGLLVPHLVVAQPGAPEFSAGRAAYARADYDRAISEFERAVAAQETNPEYHLWLGRAIGRTISDAPVLKRPFLARRLKAAFDRVVTLDPGHVAGHEELIEYYRGAPPLMGGGTDKAWAEADIVSRLNPLRGHLAKANLAIRLRDSTRAAREYSAVAAAFPDSLFVITAAAAFLASTPQASQAFVPLDLWLAKRPNDPVVLYAVGRASAVSGLQQARGERALRQVLAMPGVGTDSTLPRPAAIHYRLGDLARWRGDRSQARAEYEEALRLDPNLRAARAALEALK